MCFKKLIALCLSALFIFTFTGCDTLQPDVDGLMGAPKLEGDMSPVQQALEETVGEKITLKYPVSGEYRSAFVLKDLNGDGVKEAMAFYSDTVDSTVSVHINIIAQEGESWQSKGDLSLVGNGVESVSFSDLDGDGGLEIIVGWMVYGTVEKQVGIYTYDGKSLIQRAIEPYTNFLCADITGDKVNDLSVVYLNSAEKTASAKIFSLSTVGITEVGQTALDGGVSSYAAPVLSTLSNGWPAIYVDAVKGNGMLTEIIWYKDGILHSIYDPEAPEISLTYRNSTVSSRDYNGDGVIDIPVSELLISTAEMTDADKAYYTNWSEFDGEKFNILASTFMNYSDGYSLTVPDKWKARLLLVRKTEARMRFFIGFDPETKLAKDELFRIVAASVPDYETGAYADDKYILLDRTDTLVYLAMVMPENSVGITEKDVREMFSIIK